MVGRRWWKQDSFHGIISWLSLGVLCKWLDRVVTYASKNLLSSGFFIVWWFHTSVWCVWISFKPHSFFSIYFSHLWFSLPNSCAFSDSVFVCLFVSLSLSVSVFLCLCIFSAAGMFMDVGPLLEHTQPLRDLIAKENWLLHQQPSWQTALFLCVEHCEPLSKLG